MESMFRQLRSVIVMPSRAATAEWNTTVRTAWVRNSRSSEFRVSVRAFPDVMGAHASYSL